MKGKMNQAGEMVLIDDGQAIPSTFTDDVISVFCVGYTNFDKGKEIENFYTCFTLDKAKTLEIENKKKYAKYACPKCNSPMVHFTDNEIGCNHPPCIWGLQKGLMIVYDLNDAKVKHVFKSQEFSGVWGIEEKLRLFVTNLLDFITIKEVHISGFLSEEERRHKNEKRAEKGKEPLMPVKLINVTGHLYKYIGSIKQRYGDDAERMLREQSIKGHFFRFWSEEKWSRLYALLKGCKDDDSKEKRLAKAIRRDEDSHPLPDYQQYMWDKGLQKIKIWKEPTIRNKGCGKKDETPKVYVLGGKQDESI
jgi:ribosomal protein L37AE/L43A